MAKRAINIEVIKQNVAEFLKALRAGESVQQTVNRVVTYKKSDDLISMWAGEIDAQSIDKDEKNRVLSKFRTQLRRAAEAHELEKFPSVKRKGESYAVVWKEWPPEQSEAEEAFAEAVKQFKKDLDTAKLDKAAKAYAKAAKAAQATAAETATKDSEAAHESADLAFDETDADDQDTAMDAFLQAAVNS